MFTCPELQWTRFDTICTCRSTAAQKRRSAHVLANLGVDYGFARAVAPVWPEAVVNSWGFGGRCEPPEIFLRPE